MTKGTPKTLNEAIHNGLIEAMGYTDIELAIIIENHVKDYLAQKFMALVCHNNAEIAEMGVKTFKAITKRQSDVAQS